MKLLGIDYGKKRIGIAYSEGQFASALTTIPAKLLFDKLTELVSTLGIERIILGKPTGRLEAEVEQVGAEIARKFSREVVFYDETLTTHHATGFLNEVGVSHKKKQTQTDEVAAALMLQSYIDDQQLITKT